MKLTVDERFELDVPAAIRDSVMETLAECAQGAEAPNVYIFERDRIDAINVRAHGCITLEGEEYTFIIRDGNWDGTVLVAWNEDREFEPHPRIQWTLQPTAALLDEAFVSGRRQFLLWKWDAMILRPEIAKIPGSYAYDKMVQPGLVTEKYWRAEAAKHHFDIVSVEEATETRKRLSPCTDTEELSL